MKALIKRYVFISLFIAIVTFGIYVISYPQLPDQVPTHWNVQGEVDRYESKTVLLILGFMPLLIIALMSLLPKIDPRKKAYERHVKAYSILILYVTLFFSCVSLATLVYILGYPIDISMVASILVGIVLIAIGNYTGQFRSNFFTGIRTPWALQSDQNWRKTHRVGRWVFVISGILFLISAFVPFWIGKLVPLFFLLLGMIWIYYYSYREFVKEEESK